MRDVLPELMRWWRAGESVGVGTVVATFRSAPRPAGASMLVVASVAESAQNTLDRWYLTAVPRTLLDAVFSTLVIAYLAVTVVAVWGWAWALPAALAVMAFLALYLLGWPVEPVQAVGEIERRHPLPPARHLLTADGGEPGLANPEVAVTAACRSQLPGMDQLVGHHHRPHPAEGMPDRRAGRL